MELTTAILCDHAQVREGLLFVVAGGVRRLRRPSYPAPLGVSLALVVELDQVEMERGHQLDVRVVGPDGEEVGRVGVGFQVATAAFVPGGHGLPVVLDLHRVPLPHSGAYDVRVYIDGHHQRTLRLNADPVEGEGLPNGQPAP